MAIKTVKVGNCEITICTCERCKAQWPKRFEKTPKFCKECHSPYWNRKYQRNPKSYEKMRKREAYA